MIAGNSSLRDNSVGLRRSLTRQLQYRFDPIRATDIVCLKFIENNRLRRAARGLTNACLRGLTLKIVDVWSQDRVNHVLHHVTLAGTRRASEPYVRTPAQRAAHGR